MATRQAPTDRAPPSGAGTLPHALPLPALAAALGADPERGLSEAEAAARLARDGPNRLEERPGEPAWRRLLRQFEGLLIGILLVAAVIAFVLGETVDAGAILAIVLLNAALGFVQESRSARVIAALRRFATPDARVIRDGRTRVVPAATLVAGDLARIEAGDQIPADLRLVEAFALRAQEAALTGESTPVPKTAAAALDPDTPLAERRNMLFTGTVAAAGKGLGLVTATGMRTELGRIAALLESEPQEPTPLQRRMDRLGRLLAAVCLGLIAILAGLQLARGGALLEVFVVSVSLAVAAVPEGLPAIVTVALALGLQRMAARRALVRRLPALETLGSVTVVCTDKTGTLTRDAMTVRVVMAGARCYHVTGTGYEPHGRFVRVPGAGEPGWAPERLDDDEAPGTPVEPGAEPDLLAVLTAAARCNDARLVPDAERPDSWKLAGDPTEGALLAAALKAGVPGANAERDVEYEIPFESERRVMTVLAREPGSVRTIWTKGAVEEVLRRATRERRDGADVPLTEERRAELLALDETLARQAFRVIGLATRAAEAAATPADLERGLTFLGLAGMLDPPREEARPAVLRCRRAGIRPVMITGDHPATALAIARDVGIAGEGGAVITGRQLDLLDDDALRARVDTIDVYARVTADHKLRIIHAWRARQAVVAMTGDGVNDAPALRSADIGIAMGRSGTDVARDAADMVLLDDDFGTIVAAVEEGRGIFDNIRRFVYYLLATNAGEVMLMFLAPLAGWPLPLLPTQLLWINLVTDGLPALALGVERPERGILERAPRPPGQPVVSAREGTAILLHGALIAAAGAAAFAIAERSGAGVAHARTVTFCTIAYAQLLLGFAFRSAHLTLPQLGLFSNPALLGAIALGGALQLAAVELPLAWSVFGVSRPLAGDWWLVVRLALAPVTVVELGKVVRGWLRR